MKKRTLQTLILLTVLFQFGCGPSDGGKTADKKNPVVGTETVGVYDLCFSPDDACDEKIVRFISQARKSPHVAIYGLTHPKIAQAIVAAHQSGLTVRVIVDRLQAAGRTSLVPLLRQDQINVRVGNYRGIMHNKYTIVDEVALETGSYNYTLGASNSNAENQIYINDPKVVGWYLKDFEKIWKNAVVDTTH
jgi:phosphatidylserine/phosphatidylglycerophosphate/cardiolipin synthase-like enzyme